MQKHEIGDSVVYQGDCRDVLPHLDRVNTIVTDPVWPNCPAGLLVGAEAPYALLQQALRLCQSDRLVIVMRHDSDPRFLTAAHARWPFFRVQILPYVLPGFIGRKLGGDELAYCFGKPIPSAPGRRVIPGYAPKVQPGGRKRNGHPCSRALQHFDWLIDWWSLPGETVMDPFMGSGTTGVAAVKAGRKFIGMEIEPKYFDLACQRLEETYKTRGG